jgi:hypothetical protein
MEKYSATKTAYLKVKLFFINLFIKIYRLQRSIKFNIRMNRLDGKIFITTYLWRKLVKSTKTDIIKIKRKNINYNRTFVLKILLKNLWIGYRDFIAILIAIILIIMFFILTARTVYALF